MSTSSFKEGVILTPSSSTTSTSSEGDEYQGVQKGHSEGSQEEDYENSEEDHYGGSQSGGSKEGSQTHDGEGFPNTIPRGSLSLWDQVAPRNYMCIALCFSFPTTDCGFNSNMEHITAALSRLAKKRPEFASYVQDRGRPKEPPSALYISGAREYIKSHGVDTHLPVQDFMDHSDFAAVDFVKSDYVPTTSSTMWNEGVHRVAMVCTFGLQGGLIIFVALHHSFGDGSCMDAFLEEFADETRKRDQDIEELTMSDIKDKQEVPVRNFNFSLGVENGTDEHAFNDLIKQCPEYGLLPEPTGPTQPILLTPPNPSYCPDLLGKIFVIDKRRLDVICNELTTSLDNMDCQPRLTSRFMALAALTWAHTTKARLSTQTSSLLPSKLRDHEPTFFNPVNWHATKRGLFPSNQALKSYFGNSVALAVSKLDNISDLVEACDWRDMRDSAETLLLEKLAKVVATIISANSAINESFILTRTRLFASCPDIRYLGMTLDARAPQNFSFNTWQHLGSEAKFWLPGMDDEGVRSPRAPDAIRRVQSQWALPHALVLPQHGVDEDEMLLLVTLPNEAMEALKGDRAWMSLVKRVVA